MLRGYLCCHFLKVLVIPLIPLIQYAVSSAPKSLKGVIKQVFCRLIPSLLLAQKATMVPEDIASLRSYEAQKLCGER
ncbi:MAG: hypothetical protein WCA08_07425, partial [Desulfoferrobacter sp.]